jgi:hypothetical protein
MKRPEDIDLGLIWNSMRARQRELSWPHYWMNCQMANSSNPWMVHGPTESLLDSLLGPGLM